jgi:tetratricopeptide (TPR) repeat protein
MEMEELQRLNIRKRDLNEQYMSLLKSLHNLEKETIISLDQPLEKARLEKRISDYQKLINNKKNEISEIEKEIEKNLARQTKEKGRNPTHNTPDRKPQGHSPGNPNIRPNPKHRNVSNQNQYGVIIGISLFVCFILYTCAENKAYQTACASFEKAAKLNSSNFEDWLKLGGCQYKWKRFEEAKNSYNTLKSYSIDPQIFITKAEESKENRNYDMEAFFYGLAAPSSDFDIWLRRGDALYNSGDGLAAQSSYEKAAELSNNYKIFFDKGEANYKSGNYKMAVFFYKLAGQKFSQAPNVWFKLAEAKSKQIKLNEVNRSVEEYDQIIENYTKATNLKSNYLEAWIGKINALVSQGEVWDSKGNKAKAKENYEQAKKLSKAVIDSNKTYKHSTIVQAWISQGNAYAKLGDSCPALTAYKNAIMVNPTDSYADEAQREKQKLEEQLRTNEKQCPTK